MKALKDLKSGYDAFTELDGNVERHLTAEASEKLKTFVLAVKLPPKVEANRTVICCQNDPFVGETSRKEIQSEIERCNSILKVVDSSNLQVLLMLLNLSFATLKWLKRSYSSDFSVATCEFV